MCEHAFTHYYHHATILFPPTPQLKILYETLKFLKFEVYKKSVSLAPIFKWSWNKSTTFLCQKFSCDSSTPNEDCMLTQHIWELLQV